LVNYFGGVYDTQFEVAVCLSALRQRPIFIKLADFFGVSISQMLSQNPNFDYEKIQKEIKGKTSIANLPPFISNKKIKQHKALQIDLLDIGQSKKLIAKWLNKTNI
jgi:hypothetical protein